MICFKENLKKEDWKYEGEKWKKKKRLNGFKENLKKEDWKFFAILYYWKATQGRGFQRKPQKRGLKGSRRTDDKAVWRESFKENLKKEDWKSFS